MNDDDLLATILGNDGSGPSATSFAGGSGVGTSAPPINSWDDTGLPADIIATLPPAPSFYLTPEQEAGIRRGAQVQAAVSGLTDAVVAGAAVDTGLEALAVPKLIRTLVGGGMDVHDALNIVQNIRDAPDRAVYKSMNDTMNQAYGSPNMPGFRSRFPFP